MPEVLGQERARPRAARGCASSPRAAAGASRRPRAGSPCGPRTRPRSARRRGSRRSPAVALLELRAGVARGSAAARVGGSRASRAGAGTPPPPCRAAGAPRPRAPTRSRSACRARAAKCGRRRGRRGCPRSAVTCVAEEARQPLARRRLAAVRRVLELLLEPERAERRQPALREPRRQRAEAARRAEHRPGEAPRASGGGRARTPCTAGRPACAARARSSTAATPGWATGSTPWARSARDTASIRRRANGPTSALKCTSSAASSPASCGELALGRSAADHEAAAALGQRGVELGQAVEQELGARAGGVAAGEQPVVEAEDRHHALVAARAPPAARDGRGPAGRA